MKQKPEDTAQGACVYQGHEHCLTCGDIALSVCVVRVDAASQTALVKGDDVFEEVDISLVDIVVPGDRLLVHGGVAISIDPPEVSSN